MLLYQESCQEIWALVTAESSEGISGLGVHAWHKPGFDPVGIFVDMEPAATPFRRSAVTVFSLPYPLA